MTCPDFLRPLDAFDKDAAVATLRAMPLPERVPLDAWASSHIGGDLLRAAKAWVSDNTFFQQYQLLLSSNVPSQVAAIEAQDAVRPDRRALLSAADFALAANRLAANYDEIIGYLATPALPPGMIERMWRGHALEAGAFDRFLTSGFAASNMLRSFTIEPAAAPYFYASHNYRKLRERLEPQEVVPYILHVELNREAQALLWISAEAAVSRVRDDRWQAELVAAPGFDVCVQDVEEEDCGGCTVRHVYCSQR